jgi:hypothetical protein
LVLQAVINISDSQDKMEQSEKVFKMLLQIADRCATLKLSASARVKAEKNRKEVNKEKAKLKAEEQEEVLEQKKREEAHKVAEKLKNMTPAEQAKYEEKLHKKENDQKKKKFAKMVKV